MKSVFSFSEKENLIMVTNSSVLSFSSPRNSNNFNKKLKVLNKRKQRIEQDKLWKDILGIKNIYKNYKEKIKTFFRKSS